MAMSRRVAWWWSSTAVCSGKKTLSCRDMPMRPIASTNG
jgi:hypothetical protein